MVYMQMPTASRMHPSCLGGSGGRALAEKPCGRSNEWLPVSLQVITRDISHARGIAVDSVGNNIYFSQNTAAEGEFYQPHLLCCMFVCLSVFVDTRVFTCYCSLTLLASFFLPSHLSLRHVHMYTCTC